MRLGLIGTGLMGSSLAEKILSAHKPLGIYNRNQSKLSKLKELGAKLYDDMPKLLKDSDTVILMLSDYHAITDVLFESNIGLFEQKTIIQMGTIAPEESKDLLEKVEKIRGKYFEAPVLGSIAQILNNELIVLVGSSKEQFDQFASLFELFSNKVRYIGEIGQASAMKLALNQLIISETVAFSMSLGYVLQKNLDVDTFMDILRGSALYATTFDKKLNMMMDRNFDNPNFPLKHLLKDLDLILGEFGESNINTNSLKGIRKILVDSVENGFSEKDYSAIYNLIHPPNSES